MTQHFHTEEESTGTGIPTASIIWLHGLGADASDFLGIHHALSLPKSLNLRFVFPNAHQRPVTINAGMVMPAWYDIYGLSHQSPEDEFGIIASEQGIQYLIEKEIERGISTDRIFLAGFSQGGALALFTALRYPKKLAGVIGLSTYLPLLNVTTNSRHHKNQTTELFLAHGKNDTVLPFLIGQMTSTQLKAWNYAVTWKEYSMAHEVIGQELNDLGKWMQTILIASE